MIGDAHQKARKLIADHLDIMHEAAAYLLDKETITGEEFMAGRNLWRLYVNISLSSTVSSHISLLLVSPHHQVGQGRSRCL